MEVLVVISIIVVLVIIGFPLARGMRESARATVCMGNLKQVGGAILLYYSERPGQPLLLNGKNLQDLEKPVIWTVIIASEGYLSGWDGRTQSTKPCGTGVWTCPASDYVSSNYGGFGVVEGIFKYPAEASISGVRMHQIERPASTWLVGDVMMGKDPKKGWYALWKSPSAWSGGHAPAVGRHPKGHVNICMFDGHVESLTVEQLRSGRHTQPAITTAP